MNIEHFQFMNTIKVYAHKPGPVSKAIIQVIALFEQVSGDHAIDEADVILVTEREHLNALYRKDKPFALLNTRPGLQPSNLPENVYVLLPYLTDKEKGLIPFIDWLKAQLEKAKTAEKTVTEPTEEFTDFLSFKQNYRVLILDNDPKNLEKAAAMLKGHSIVMTKSLESAVGYCAPDKFDAVLTDMQMPLDRHFGALSPDAINPALEVPYGFAMVFEATRRGIPVAVVTDGNHHQDWVSAMFDRITSATVNGQKVLFLNSIGKRWDKALKRLLEE